MKKMFFLTIFIGIIVVSYICFSPCINNSFNLWDDKSFVIENPLVKQGLSLQNIENIFFSFHHNLYHPLVILSFAIEYSIAKFSQPYVSHLTNVVLHLINTMLVFLVILNTAKFKYPYKNFRILFISSVTTLLFSIHPTRVESVAWITERKDVLSAMFFLLSLLMYIYYKKSMLCRHWLYLSFIFFCLSLLCKPTAVILPIVFVLYDKYIFDKAQFSTIKSIKEKVVLIIPVVILIIVNLLSHYGGEFKSQFLYEHIKNFYFISFPVYNIGFCLYKIFLPIKLACFYSTVTETTMFLFFVSLFFFMITIICLFLKSDKIRFGLLFFLIVILPSSGLLPAGFGVPADRYTYLSSIGVFYIIAVMMYIFFVCLFVKKKNLIQISLLCILLFVSIIFGRLTFQRCILWSNEEELWYETAKSYPTSASWCFYGNILKENKKWELAVEAYKKSIQLVNKIQVSLTKSYWLIQNYLGLIESLFCMKKYKDVIVYSKRAFEIINNFSKYGKCKFCVFYKIPILYNVTLTNQILQQYYDALKYVNEAIKLNPSDVKLYIVRGTIYTDIGLFDNAIKDLKFALSIDKKNAEDYLNLGNLYFQQSMLDDALKMYNKALILEPNFASGYLNRANVYIKKKEFDKAKIDLYKFIKLSPGSLDGHYNLAMVFIKEGDFKEAHRILKTIIKTKPDYYMAYKGLAELYLNTGDLNQALNIAVSALKYTNNTEIYNLVSEIYIDMNKIKEAKEYAELAIKLNPNDFKAYYNLAICYVKMRNYGTAIKYFDKVIKLNPKDIDAYKSKGVLLYIIKNYNEAVKVFTKLIEYFPKESIGYYYRARTYYELGEYEKAYNDLITAKNLGCDKKDPEFEKTLRQKISND